MIWKLWKKGKSKSDKIWTIRKKGKLKSALFLLIEIGKTNFRNRKTNTFSLIWCMMHDSSVSTFCVQVRLIHILLWTKLRKFYPSCPLNTEESCIIHQIKENVFVFLFLKLVFPISINRKYTYEVQNVGLKIDMEHVVCDITEEVLKPYKL
jgi:hypothetical protein